MAKKKVRKELDQPADPGYTGLAISRKPVEYTPNDLLDSLNAPKENRPVFMLSPYTTEERHLVDGEGARVRSLVALWAKKHGVDTSHKIPTLDENGEHKKTEDGDKIYHADARDVSAWFSKYEELEDKNKLANLVRKKITGFRWSENGKKIVYKTDEEGYLAKEIFDIFPPALVSEISKKLTEISNPTTSMMWGLLS